MCGIAGIWRLKNSHPEDVKRLQWMADSLTHRGPNDFGYLLANSERGQTYAGKELAADFVPDILLASRRLSILDLTSQGRQPIGNEADDVFIVFNGAIHNYLELRDELEGLGHVFRSQTDTEVIVHAYEQWGPECARRFNGMWAYVIWDKQREQLVCSRDRFGIKPMVLAWHNNSFYFASEIKAIFSTGDVPAVANLAYVRRHLNLSMSVNGCQTAFEGIEQLTPGHNLVITRTGRHESAYWSYDDRSSEYDFKHPVETFRELFVDAVRLRMRSDVPIALLLSGGLDSSSIAAAAQQETSGGALKAFTFTFPNHKADERRHAEIVAKHCGLQQHFLEFDSSHLLDDLSSITWHMDSPPALGQMMARWHLLKAASQEAKIVLEGQGADEMLGGYPDLYRWPYVHSELNHLSPGNFHRVLPRISSAYFGLSTMTFQSKLRMRAKTLLTRQSHAWPSLISQELAAGSHLPDAVAPILESCFPDHLTQALQKDHAHSILPHLLHFGDALSMAHSVESRLPFLDHRLVEFVFGLPFDQKIRGAQTKHILRQALTEKLPPRISHRRDKVGFSTPLQQWLQPNLEEAIRPMLTSKCARERGIINPNVVQQYLSALDAGSPRATLGVFRCLALETWFELFIDRNWSRN